MIKIVTKKDSISEDLHGIRISDPYRWLEEGDNPEVGRWVNAQNDRVRKALKNKIFKVFSDELVKNFKTVNFSAPSPVKGRYFYTERRPDENQGVLYMKKGLEGRPVKLFDPNKKAAGNTVAIAYWHQSRSGKYVDYGISEGGDEMATLYVKNTDTNKETQDKIANCRYSSVVWLSDDSGFFYTRNAQPGKVPKNEEHLHMKVYFHKLGDKPDQDELIFGAGRPKDDIINLSLSLEDRYLGIRISRNWTENEIYIYDCKTKKTKSVVNDVPSKFSIIFLKNKVLLYTNYKANNYRILHSPYEKMYRPVKEWEELIPESKFLLESLRITSSKILVEYLVNACSEVCVFNYEGKETGKIPLPRYSCLTGISSRRDEEEFFYGVESFTFPKVLYRYDPLNDVYSEYRRTYNPIDPENFEVKQEWYTSTDGTKVPLFIFHKKGLKLNSNNPTILYGYGGFGHTEVPCFIKKWLPWIERGGIFAIANIRGGGEFGEKWHKGGIGKDKQNSFDDFIAAGEYLIKMGYADKNCLGIIGGSNGGLLVSAVAIQRPDLFKAVCSQVPLTDMVRFHRSGVAVRWVHEYGNPDDKNDLKQILKWSPYHNVKEGSEYPNFFLTTAEKDTRVDPFHARKMAARLQEVNKKNDVLLLTETEAGHGPGKPVVKIIQSQALVLSFFAKNLNLKL